MCEEMLDAVNKLARDGTVGVLVVTGSGRAFSVGLDLDWARSIVGRRKQGKEVYDIPD